MSLVVCVYLCKYYTHAYTHCQYSTMNEVGIKKVRWENKDKRISLGDCLYLQVRKSSKTYLVIKRGKDKSSTTTLGKSPQMSLRDAKIAAVNLLKSTAASISTTTVEDLADKYWKEVAEPNYKQPKQAIGYYNQIKKSIGRKKVRDIKRSDLVAFIQAYSKRGARTGDRMRSYLRMIFSYAVELGYIDHSPMEEVSKRITGYKYAPRKRLLTDTEIKWLFADDFYHKRALRFLLLTGLRVGEMWKGYQDGDKWRIDDTKGRHAKEDKHPHWVYLTDSAKACLPIKKVSNEALQHWLRAQQDEPDRSLRWTPHDCRRTYSTIAHDNGVMPHIVEKCLNHVMEGVMAVYNHAEYEVERIDAAKRVEKIVLEIVNNE